MNIKPNQLTDVSKAKVKKIAKQLTPTGSKFAFPATVTGTEINEKRASNGKLYWTVEALATTDHLFPAERPPNATEMTKIRLTLWDFQLKKLTAHGAKLFVEGNRHGDWVFNVTRADITGVDEELVAERLAREAAAAEKQRAERIAEAKSVVVELNAKLRLATQKLAELKRA